MTPPLMAAPTAETLQYYWFHQLLASAAWGLAFFLLGLFLAALLWGGARRKAHALRSANQRLLSECRDLERSRTPTPVARLR